MKIVALAAIIGGLLISAPGHAADLAAKPYYKAAAPVAYLPWNRCYVGASGGYITSDRGNTTITPNDADLLLSQTLGNVPTSLSADPDGGIIGGTLGCNYQTGSIVLGAETDLSYTSLRDTSSVVLGAFATTTRYSQEMEAFGTVRGRLGYAIGPTLLYATGGLAYGYVKTAADIFPGPLGLGGAVLVGRQDEWRAGWTVGAGVEHMISQNWSIKAEYLYYDLGTSALTAVTVAGIPATESGTFRHDNTGHIIRAGINYQFDSLR